MGAVANRLSDADALIWRIEGDPVLRSPILVIGLLDREPPWPRVLASLRRTVEAIPRLHQRVVSGPLGARPCWVDDDAFSLEHHVRRVRAATAGGMRAVLDVAEPDVMTAFDPARPPWQLTIVDGLEGGAAAFVLRFHHAITDGVGGIGLTERLFDSTRRSGRVDVSGNGQHAPRPGPDEEAAREHVLRPGAAGAVAVGLVRAGLDPVGTVLGGVRTARSVARMLAPARAPLSPLMHGRGLDRRLHVLDLPLAGLQRAAHRFGGTVNDVLLAAIAGGLRDYHEACGAPVDALRVTMPISIRKPGDPAGGNRFTPSRFILPVNDPDPRRRIELAGSIVRAVRSEPAIGLTPMLAWALGLLPAPLVQRAFAGMLRSMDVDAVDVPGLAAPAYLAGSRVERLWAFAPPTGAAMSITLMSHLQSACVGIAADMAAVADPELLATCLERGFDEVLALAGDSVLSGVPA